jgi:hypothetical protein
VTQKLVFDEISYTFKSDEVIAFWYYDQYPYTLWGTVTKRHDNGNVSVKEYGGSVFKPKTLLPRSKAEPVIQHLSQLKKERDRAMGLIAKEYRIKLAELAERYAIPMPVEVFK